MTDDHDNVIRFPHCARRVDDLDAELAKLEGLLGTTRMRYYKLDGHTPIRVETLKAWADEVAQHDRIAALTGIDPWRVAVTKIDDVVISTVFLGLDYRRSRRGPPLLFETKVFGGSLEPTLCNGVATTKGSLRTCLCDRENRDRQVRAA